jgi:hypothetical protein
VSHSTTAPARGPCSVFAPGGQPWTALPDLPRGVARDTFYAVMRAARGKTQTMATDCELGDLGDLSPRSVQRGLLELEKLGVIARERVGHHGSRLITITVKLAGRDHSPAPAPPVRQPRQDHSPAVAIPSSQREKQRENAAPSALPVSSRADDASSSPILDPLPPPAPFLVRVCPHLIPPEAWAQQASDRPAHSGP